MITQAQIDEHKACCEKSKQELGIGSGPWDGEPHRVDFEAYGLSCLLHRNPLLWNWCGYVGVPKGHPVYGKEYSKLETDISIHGGLTYGDKCKAPICHISKTGEADELFWLGFDCAHAVDIVPGMEASMKWLEEMRSSRLSDSLKGLRETLGYRQSYKTVNYVKNETLFLAVQLAKLGE